MKNREMTVLASLALIGLPQVVSAQNTAEPVSPWYIGLGLSQNQGSVPQETIDGVNSVLSPALGSAFTVVDRDDRTTGLKASLGYGFSRYLAVEGGYVTLGKPKVNFDFRSGINSVGTFDMEYSMSGIFADVVGSMPLGESWALIGRLGVNIGKTRINYSGSPLTLVAANDDREETKVREKFGAGIQYMFNQSFSLRAEWERYRMPDPFSDKLIDMDSATASFLYRF